MAQIVKVGGSREASPAEADRGADHAAQDEVSAGPDRAVSEAMRRALQEDMDRREGVYRRLAK